MLGALPRGQAQSIRLWLWRALLLMVLAGLSLVGARAQELQPVPPLTSRVLDQTGTLTPEQRQALEAKLARFEEESGPQIVVLMIQSPQPEDLTSFAYRVADTWKIGRRGVGDGLLIVVAKTDRRVRIEVAKDLEGAIPDLAARQVIDQAMKPAFRQGDYAGGLHRAVDQLMARVQGEALPAPRTAQRQNSSLDWQEVAMLLFIGVPVAGSVLSSVLGRKLGVLATGVGTGMLAGVITASLLMGLAAGVLALIFVGVLGVGGGRRGGGPVIWGGGGHWGGNGNGGGGFSSGGGGDFGGGGASGDW